MELALVPLLPVCSGCSVTTDSTAGDAFCAALCSEARFCVQKGQIAAVEHRA